MYANADFRAYNGRMATTAPLDSVAVLATAIRRARKEQGLTQAVLAERAGVSRLFVIELEAGHPRAELGKTISVLDVLGMNPFVPAAGGATAEPYQPPFVVADSLSALRGPASGEVSLPNRLLWNPSRPFDLSDEKRLRSMIRIVLREARSQDDLNEFVDRDSLVRLWPRLGLPKAIREGWEARFPELARVAAR